jgi:hypothetical protein
LVIDRIARVDFIRRNSRRDPSDARAQVDLQVASILSGQNLVRPTRQSGMVAESVRISTTFLGQAQERRELQASRG